MGIAVRMPAPVPASMTDRFDQLTGVVDQIIQILQITLEVPQVIDPVHVVRTLIDVRGLTPDRCGIAHQVPVMRAVPEVQVDFARQLIGSVDYLVGLT
jgi:hypothetical protein